MKRRMIFLVVIVMMIVYFLGNRREKYQATPSSGCTDMTVSPFTSGMIAMWSGSVSSLPIGWVLCDGQNGTPDLRGRFLLGLNSSSSQAVGLSSNMMQNIGGEEKVVLKPENLPSHTHNYTEGGEYRVCSDCQGHAVGDHPFDRLVWKESAPEGKSLPHNNMPPYYVLAFVMKL